jgi:hypothetical protein
MSNSADIDKNGSRTSEILKSFANVQRYINFKM